MKPWIPIAIVLLALTACEKRSVPPQENGVAADSLMADTMSAVPDTMLAKSDAKSMSDSKAASASYAPTIGHDSAFGPIGSINDSTGKFTKIPPRRP